MLMQNSKDRELTIEKKGSLWRIPEFEKGKLRLKNCGDLTLEIGENAEIDLLEIKTENGGNLNIHLNANSKVRYNVFTDGACADGTRAFTLEEGAHLLGAYADFGKGTKKTEVRVDLNGRRSEVSWHLAALSQGDDDKIFSINFNHNVGETKAKMENYGVCKNRSSLQFLGDAVIVKGAKKSSTNQSAKIMVFDEACRAKASPKLCIYENDVEASHGASEGQIPSDHIFYLMSRGISEEDARRLITLGYLYPILSYFEDEEIVSMIRDTIVERL